MGLIYPKVKTFLDISVTKCDDIKGCAACDGEDNCLVCSEGYTADKDGECIKD